MELDPTTLPKQNDRAEWPRLQAALARRFLDHTQAEWAEIFEGSDACVSPVLTLAEAARHPHNVARGILTDVAGIPHPTPAPRFSRSRCTITRPPAREGEHSVEVLRDWGLSQAEIDAGLSEGYIAARTTPA